MLSQAIQQVLFTRPLEKEVPDIVKKYGGSLYIPSPANCFQDSAGTTPCTVDSPVGYLKDLVGTNHATQGTAGYKPILRGKVKNLFQYSEDLSHSSWTKSGVTVSSVITSSPSNNTSYKLVEDSTTATHRVFNNVTIVSGAIYTASFYVKNINRQFIQANLTSLSTNLRVVFDISNGIVSDANAGGTSPISSSISSITNGWYRCSVTFTATASGSVSLPIGGNSSSTGNGQSYTGSSSDAFYLWGVQLELGSTANPYIPTTSAAASSSYGPYWLDFDGTDDRLQLGSVPFQLQDDPFMVFGNLAFLDATIHRRIFSTGNSSGTPVIQLYNTYVTGVVSVNYKDDAATSIFIASSGDSSNKAIVNSSYKYGNRKVIRKNTVLGQTNNAALSTSTNVLSYIGADMTPSNFLKGNLYFIALGKGNVSDLEITKIEKYAAKLSGAQL